MYKLIPNKYWLHRYQQQRRYVGRNIEEQQLYQDRDETDCKRWGRADWKSFKACTLAQMQEKFTHACISCRTSNVMWEKKKQLKTCKSSAEFCIFAFSKNILKILRKKKTQIEI